jgi:hypothetical protein
MDEETSAEVAPAPQNENIIGLPHSNIPLSLGDDPTLDELEAFMHK